METGVRADRTIDVLPTGVNALDEILGGGIPVRTMTLIAGVPGAGKTILAEQIAVEQAKRGAQVVVFTALSESHESLLKSLRAFSFFDESLIGDRIRFINVHTLLRDGLGATAEAIVGTARAQGASVAILDGFRGIAGFAESDSEVRQFLYEVRSQLALLGVTSLVTFETMAGYDAEPGARTVADGIITLHHTLAGVQARRQIEVQKLRGMKHLGGLHAMQITTEGIICYPRHEALYRDLRPAVSEGRASTGLSGLDAMLGGGFNRGTITVVAGTAGVGKTLMMLHYLLAGANVGEPGLYLGFGEGPEQLYAKAAAFGMDLHGMVQRGLIQLHCVAPVEMELDVLTADLRRRVEQGGIQRLVIDSVFELESAILEPNRAPNYFAALFNYLRGRGVTATLTRESAVVSGTDIALRESIVTILAETLVVLRTIESRDQQFRTIAVSKMRQSALDPTLHELRVVGGAVEVVPIGESDSATLDKLAHALTIQDHL